MHQNPSKFLYVFICLTIMLALIGIQPVYAASIVVTSAADEDPSDPDNGLCSLREAITAANTDSAVDSCSAGSGSDTITFDANYTITLSGAPLPSISTSITINGNGITNTIVQAHANPNTATYRVLSVASSGNLTLNNLTVRHGVCSGSCDAGNISAGGGIYSQGTLTINSSSIVSNYVIDGGGGIFANGGTVTITNSSFTDNSSYNGGGAIANFSGTTMNISNSTITNNTSTDNSGGGIANTGTMNIYNSTISGNSSSGGVYDGANLVQGDFGSPALSIYNTIIANSGGSDGDCGIFRGTITATNTLIESTGALACGLTNNVNGNIIGLDPNLGSLTGSPAYFPLNSGSLAINAGDNTICANSPVNNTSQNGMTRPQGINCDIGAYEKSGGTLPTSPTFGDVPLSHPYFEDIEILYANGFTAGCSTSPLMFCPETTMNRAQAAVFMLRGNFGAGYLPPAPPWNTFSDDFSPGSWAQSWVQGMWNAGLTGGCSTSPMLYCPWEDMPRMQVAVFALRLMHGSSYVPPAGTGTVFADITDPTLWYAGWAEQAYADGLLPACGFSAGKPLFCPNELVSRGLGAFAIVKAKNLSMP